MASPESSQPKRPPELSRTATRALRTLGTSEDIQCTESLIRAYNANDVEDVNGVALHRWLDAYVREFSKQRVESLPESWIREYALLAMIDVKNSAAEELVGRVYASLRACVKSGQYCPPIIVIALDNMLTEMDAKIVMKETESLISLANDLLCLTDPKRRLFSRDTYAFHMACLLTLEKTLVVLHKAERTDSKQWIIDFFQGRLRTQLNSIASSQKYYPFVYNTQLIRCNIEGLIKGNSTDMLLSAGRRIFYALCGGLYLFQGVRELAVMKLDFAAIEAGVLKMQKAFGGMINTLAFGLKEVMLAAKKSQEKQDFSYIIECYGKHKYPTCWDRIVPNRLKTIKFALVSHLTLFATDSSTSNLSDPAFRLLSNLATNKDTAHWRADPDIYESLLDALASVGAKNQPLRRDCLQLLREMENTSIWKHQTVVKDWRGLNSLEQKLHKNCVNESANLFPSFYDTVRQHLGLHLTYVGNLKHKQKLIKYYQNDDFAKVSLLLDNVKKRHIADFDFHIVVYELVDATNQVLNNVSSTGDDQMAHNLERCNWVQTPIHLQDIFAPRRQKPFGPKDEVSRVLLLGNPGTGKTSLSKRLCHGWATGTWGPEFERVYLLQVRQLTGNRLQSEKTLEGAIAILLFDADEYENERIALQRQIKDQLDEQTTLLMIDKLDEGSGNDIVEKIVKDATSRSCCILVLSRPHNLGDVRSKMEIQVECLGFNDHQLAAYVCRETPNAPRELIQFLNKSLLVWTIAKVPVNAHILCTLWKSEDGQRLKELKSLNLKSLYSSMTEYAWQRFVQKTGEKADRQAVFRSLEIIAFKSINQSKIEIPLDMVMKHAQGTTTVKLFSDAGFLLFYKEGEAYQFAHLSFHEFFAGKFLAKCLRGTEKESKKAMRYIAERKYYDTSRVTLSFMTQCYCQEEDDDDAEDCIKSLKQLLSFFDKNPVEVLGFLHILLKMRTLDAFLSVCESCAEDIRLDDELQRLVISALKALQGWLKAQWQFGLAYSMYNNHSALYDQIMEDLAHMPNLFTHLPEFLLTVLRHRSSGDYHHQGPSRIARLVSYGPEQLLEIMPREERDDEKHHSRRRMVWYSWFKLAADCGPECAALTLKQLKIVCQDEREEFRSEAYAATVYFLKVLPDQEDLHFLCMDAIKDTSAEVRFPFMNVLGFQMFKPNSAAANLAWTLTVEATRDDDEGVRREAYSHVVRNDQTSEESIGTMVELLLEYMPMCVDSHSNHRNSILQNIHRILRRFPSVLTVFLPYLATCCNDPTNHIRRIVVDIIQDLPSFFPTPQKKELGEMIAEIYSTVEDPTVRKGLVTVLYDIGQATPQFMTEFPDIFSQGCTDIDNSVSELAKDKKTMTMIISAESVDAINKVFWDQSFGVKKELLRQILRESMIDEETAEVVLEMAANCLESNNTEVQAQSLSVLSSLTRFRSLSSMVLQRLVYGTDGRNHRDAMKIVFKQPLAVLLQYFWDTTDKRVVRPIAEKHMLASVTCQTARDGKTIVSVVERGKTTQLEVQTELVEELISLVKHQLHETFGDFLP